VPHLQLIALLQQLLNPSAAYLHGSGAFLSTFLCVWAATLHVQVQWCTNFAGVLVSQWTRQIPEDGQNHISGDIPGQQCNMPWDPQNLILAASLAKVEFRRGGGGGKSNIWDRDQFPRFFQETFFRT